MATTGIWKVEKRLDHVIDYVINPEKTMKDGDYQELHKLDGYEKLNYETEEECFVSALNCSTHRPYKDMMLTKELYGRKSGILGYHAFQSFKEGEITPTQAHLIGVKLAEEIWGDRFEVIVSTHTNCKHIHNHFVINSVSFKDGKKYHDSRETYALIREVSDTLCEEYGLSVVKDKKVKKVNYDNYYQSYVKKTNYHTFAKQDLDRAIGMATSYYDFEDLMKAMDYELIYRGDKLSIKRSPYKKNIRIERYFGNEYSIDRIKQRIDEEYIKRVPFIEEYGNKKKYNANYYKKRKPKGFYALYIHYCYLLRVFPKKYPYQKLSPAIRADVRKMEEISNETRLLVRNNLKTDEQFFAFKEDKEKRLEELMDQRSKLWYKHKKSKSKQEKEEIKEQIDNLNKEINPLRKEVVLCKDIIERSKKMEQNLRELSDEKNQEKEVEKNEHIR